MLSVCSTIASEFERAGYEDSDTIPTGSWAEAWLVLGTCSKRHRCSRCSDQFADRLTRVGERDGAALAIGEGLFDVESDDVVDGGEQIAGSQGAIVGFAPVTRCRTDDLSASQAAAA
jgi:hypothetical protein